MFASIKELLVTRVLDPLAGALPRNVRSYCVHHALRREATEVGAHDRESLARGYLRGAGLEVGALNSPLPIDDLARVSYVDFETPEELRRRHPNLQFKSPDIVDDGARLASVADESQDFLIACHLIEHMEDPIGAVKNWLRVLKPGGILFLAIPDRRFTFDFHRPATTWEHLKRDHEEGPAWSRTAHFEEVFRKVVGVEDEERVRRLAADPENRDTHFHVWSQTEMLEFVAALRRYGLDFEVEAFCAYGNEGTFVLRKGAREDLASAEESLKAVRAEFEETSARAGVAGPAGKR
ncbi:MAG: methyltransferase domain-containing protein [Acidobacteria bacterium]|nr:methyltransferase domain-containing protein [Acidobacteriota bacterium]